MIQDIPAFERNTTPCAQMPKEHLFPQVVQGLNTNMDIILYEIPTALLFRRKKNENDLFCIWLCQKKRIASDYR